MRSIAKKILPRRSCLAVPASSRRKLEKAQGIAADELVFDLEDAVVPAAKDEARAALVEHLTSAPVAGTNCAARINAPRTPWFHLDLAALAALADQPRSVVVPKVESAADIAAVESLLDGSEAGGRPRLRIQALIETAAGLARVDEIAAAGTHLDGLILGYADLAASLGRSRQAAAEPTMWLVAQDAVLIAARANGLQAIDGPYLGTEPDEGFLAAARHARYLGFDGKWAIHPSQIEALNEIFTPSNAEVERARAVIEALAGAERDGRQGAVALDGEMIDEAVRLGAERVLARAGTE